MTPTAPRTLGWVAVGVTLAIAVGLTLLRARSDAPLSMPPVGLLGFFAAFAGSGLVAAVGLARSRPELLVASAVVLICLAPLSMAGVTLVFLAPAVILIYVAGRLAAPRLPAWLRGATALVTICLLAAAPVALFSNTEIVCWEDYGGGSIEVRVLPEMPTESSSVAPFGGGCSSGSITALGGGLSMLAVAGAITVAASAGKSRITPR